MKYNFLILFFILLTSTAQASYCSGKNWQDTYQFYTLNIDLLNTHIDSYNALLSKVNLSDVDEDEQKSLDIKSAINALDELNIDVEILARKFDNAEKLWQLISKHCLDDDEPDYNNKAIENARGAEIGRTEVYDLLSKITSLRIYFFKLLN